jgi:hypothetical protein
LAVGSGTLRCYAHPFSPKKYAQPQLLAGLILKAFFKTDYRRITIPLDDLPDLATM